MSETFFPDTLPAPEITICVDGKNIKSTDYGWDGHDFVVVDKDTGKKYVFTNASLGEMTPQHTNDIVKVEDVEVREMIMGVDYAKNNDETTITGLR